MPKGIPLEITGQRFGRWKVLRRNDGCSWLCGCDCGTVAVVQTGNLRNGKTTGCHKCADRTVHGLSRTSIYARWYRLKSEGVVRRWERVDLFAADVGDPPKKNAELARIDESKAWGPKNFRWGCNRRRRPSIKFKDRLGREHTQGSLAALLGVTRQRVHQLIRYEGVTVDQILARVKS